MIRSFRHRGLKRFFESGRRGGIQSTQAKRLTMLLAALNSAYTIQDMELPGCRLHALKGRQAGRWSIRVNANWRLTFEFREGNVFALDYEDYH
jgi:proteic killer suppression protein